MNVATFCLAAALACISHGAAATGGRTTKERPVAKVVHLLEDMKAELENERAEDEEVYKKLDCWCETNGKEKGKAIELNEAKMEDLRARLQGYAAKLEEIKEALGSTRSGIKRDQEALDKATVIREQEAAAFNAEENELIDIVNSIKQALEVLSKHNPSMAQLNTVSKIFTTLKSLPHSKDAIGSDKMAALDAFLQQAEYENEERRSGIPVFKSYSSQSGQIFGILKQMQVDFESNLGNAQKQEANAKQEFVELKAAKQAELAAGKTRLAQLEQDDADFREKDVQAYEELTNTREQLQVDKEFMYNLKQRCTATEAEYAARVKSRNEEILAVTDTIAILSDDDAFENFDKTVNTAAASFLQLGSSSADAARKRRAAAQAVLRRSGVPRLALLADSVQRDAFTKVKAAIDKMVAELEKQQQEERELKQWCYDEKVANKRATTEKEDKKSDLQTSIQDMGQSIKKLTEGIATMKAAIAQMEAEMKKASEIREAENADYQETISDQRVTQAILKKAIERMSQVYAFAQQPGAPHTELSGSDTDPGSGPARFSKYEQKQTGGRVVEMLEKIMADSKRMENEAIQDEQAANAAYESFMQDSNKSIKENQRGVVAMSEDKAKTEQALTAAKNDLKDTLRQLEELFKVAADLSKTCDWSLRNFDVRQQARATEIDALKEAKAILAGMK